MSGIKVNEAIALNRTVRTVDSHESLTFAIDAMRSRGIHHLVVLTGGEVVGMVSEQDLFTKGIDAEAFLLATSCTIADVMIPIPCGITPSTTLQDALEMMWKYQVTALPIQDPVEHNASDIKGIVTAGDLLHILAKASKEATPGSVDAATRGAVILSHPLMQNAMQLLNEAGI